jgi:hypothetical protein
MLLKFEITLILVLDCNKNNRVDNKRSTKSVPAEISPNQNLFFPDFNLILMAHHHCCFLTLSIALKSF